MVIFVCLLQINHFSVTIPFNPPVKPIYPDAYGGKHLFQSIHMFDVRPSLCGDEFSLFTKKYAFAYGNIYVF
jgi:hypothetical protein